MTDPVDEWLAHFGVKGMRWGHRKDESKSSKDLVKSANKHFNTQLSAATEIRLHQMLGNSAIDSSKLSNRGRTVKAGRQVYRVSKTKNKDIQDVGYISTNSKDRQTYRGVLGSMGIFGSGARRSHSDTYETVFEATKDLTLASPRARFDAFVDLMDTPSVTVGSKQITGREYLRRTGYGREVNRLESIALGEKFYTDFVSNQGMKTPLNSAYFKALKDRGYDAISDDNDRNIVSNDPLIVLDTKSSLRVLSVHQLTNDDINKAIGSFTPAKNIEKVRADLAEQNSKKKKEASE